MCIATEEDCSKANALFKTIDNTRKNDKEEWYNVVSIGLDNINSNMDSKNSVKFSILQ